MARSESRVGSGPSRRRSLPAAAVPRDARTSCPLPGSPRTTREEPRRSGAVWRALEKAGDDAELERIKAMSGDELDAELRAAGLDPAEAAKIGVDVLGPVPAAPPANRRVYWIAAFAVAALVIGVLVTRPRGGPPVATPHPDTEAALKEAAGLRDRAFGACDQGDWAACEDAQNAAQSLNPAGETAPRVVAARRSIEAVADAGRGPEKTPKR